MSRWMPVACLSALALVARLPLRAADEKPSPWEGKVDALVRPLMAKKKTPGLVVGVMTPGGGREFFCYGELKAGGPRPSADTLFEIGSVSKPITGLMLALMAEKGEVKLDDPARRHIPKGLVVPRRGEREITLLELATHTSGLPRNPPNQQRLVLKDAAVAVNPYGTYDAKSLADGLAEIRLKDEARPGFAYSNLGAGLLGEALAHRAGMSYPELARALVFGPLNMKDTSAAPSRGQRGRMATGHGGNGKALPGWTFLTLHGCGAVCSTPNDLLAFHEAYCGRAATRLRKAMRATLERRSAAFGRTGTGLGWFVQEVAGRTAWWHNGGTSGFKTCNWFCEKPPVALVILCNSGSDAVDDGRDFYRMGEALFRQLVEAGKAAEK